MDCRMQLISPAIIAEEVLCALVANLDVRFQFAIRVEFFDAAFDIANNLRFRVDLQMPSQIQRTVKLVAADVADLIFHLLVPLDVHLQVFDTEEAFAA